jgi:hypothetical protein
VVDLFSFVQNRKQKMKSISWQSPGKMRHKSSAQWNCNPKPVESLIVVSCLRLSVCADEAEMDRDSSDNNSKRMSRVNELLQSMPALS